MATNTEQRTLFVSVLLGTVRQGRRSESVALWLHNRLSAREGVEAVIVDPRDLHLSEDVEGTDLVEQNQEYKNTIEKSDGLIIVSPEYNHSYPGTVKRVIDMLEKESYSRRAVATCGVSTGVFGGARMMEHMHSLTHTMRLLQSPTDLYVPNAREVVMENDDFVVDAEFEKRADAFLDDLIWLAKTLRWGREHT